MKNKKMLLICGAALLVLAVVLLIVFLGGSGDKDEPAEKEATSPVEDAQPTESAPDGEKELTEEPEEESTESAQLIESEGDLIITIPDDEESDGF